MDQELLEQLQMMLDAIERTSKEAEARIITRTEVLMETIAGRLAVLESKIA